MNTEKINLPSSFRVIGVGHGIENIINRVNSFGFEGVSAEVVKYPFDCTPQDQDKLAIICFTDCDDNANRIAKTFHDAGVLTIGFSEDVVPSYYDSIMERVSSTEYPEIIRTLLQPIVSPGIISYDFHDLSTTLRDSGYFTVKTVSGNDVIEACEKLQDIFNKLDLNCVNFLAIHLYFDANHLYFNSDNPTSTAKRKNIMISLLELTSALPKTVNCTWSINKDEKLNGDEIKLTAILAGKDLWKCQAN